MKICFLNRSFYPDFGATGQLLTELAEDLVQVHGCEVTVITGWIRGEQGFRLVAEDDHRGVRVLRARGTDCSRESLIGRVANYLSYAASACLASLRMGRADVVVALTDPPVIGLLGFLSAKRTGAKFVFVCQDVFPEVATLLTGFRNRPITGFLQFLNRFLIRRADRVVALGACMKNRLIEGKNADPERLTVICNWADGARIRPLAKSNEFSRRHGLDEKFVVMHSGNMGLSQELDRWLSVAERLNHVSDLAFVLVGDGVRRQSLEARVEKAGLSNVQFMDYQPKERLSETFSTADVFLISLKQGVSGYIVPSKLYGVLAAGRPFVASIDADSEVARVAGSYDCGIVVPPGDLDAMVDAIEQLRTNAERRRAMGVRAREASERYDRTTQVSAYYKLLTELDYQVLRNERTPRVSAQTEL